MPDHAFRSRSRRGRIAIDDRRNLRVGAFRAGDGHVDRALADQPMGRRIEAHPEVGVEIAVFARARQKPRRAAALERARISVVRVPGNHRRDRRVELVEDRQDVAGKALAALLFVSVGHFPALVDQEHDRVRALRLQLRDQRVGDRGFVLELKPGDPAGADQRLRFLEGLADETDLDRPDLADRGRREDGRAVASDHIRREIFETRAGERLEPARHASRVLFASALLHPQKLGRALVELVVADRGEAEAQQVHRIDRRLVEEIGRGERRGADEVARRRP